MPSNARESFFVTCAPGLEPVLHEEMKALKLAKVERQVSGVYFEGTLRDAMRANLWLRTAVRVLMRVARFPAANADELYAGAHDVEWGRFIDPTGSLVVDAHSTSSALDHTLFIAQRVKDAVVDGSRAALGDSRRRARARVAVGSPRAVDRSLLRFGHDLDRGRAARRRHRAGVVPQGVRLRALEGARRRNVGQGQG